MKVSVIPKPKHIGCIVIAGVVNLLILSSCVAALMGAPSATSPTPSNSQPAAPTSPAPAPIPTVAAKKGSVLYALHKLRRNGNPQPIGGYDRDEFGQKWADVDRNGCDQRNDVLRRDMRNLHTKPGTNGCDLAKAP